MTKTNELPLNPQLYRLLKRRFGDVRISNPGEAAQIVIRRNIRHRNRPEPEAVHPGEYYQVCCPFCSDTRHRLYVNHMFGQQDKEEGFTYHHLAICFNENCLAETGRVQDFIEDLTELEHNLEKFKVTKGKAVDISNLNMDWPGAMIRVDKLPKDHRAYQYLVSRKFDPQRIGKFYNVHWCVESTKFWMANERLIIPIYEDKRMVGWQGRLPYEPKKGDSIPKYYTCPGTPRRMIIYNFANAIRYRTGVIVEGPTDVWSFGPMACCTLGATMTPHQQRKFLDHFKQHSAILLFDPEEYEKPKVQKLITDFSTAFEGGFAAVKLPEGTDPGTLDRDFLRDFVKEQAEEQGVKVSWRKR
jgi:hypothetical protein